MSAPRVKSEVGPSPYSSFFIIVLYVLSYDLSSRGHLVTAVVLQDFGKGIKHVGRGVCAFPQAIYFGIVNMKTSAIACRYQ